MRQAFAAGLLALVFACAAVLGGCGGGVGTGGTGSFATGPITGFGSIIVNGVRYDDSTAAVQDADGAARSRDDLRLGMTVEVEADDVVEAIGGASARATNIRYTSELVGVIATADPAAGVITLLGQTVLLNAATVVDDALAGGLAAGQRVAVYGAWDAASRRYRATRIEAQSGGNFRVRGVVSQLDTARRSLVIGTGSFSYTGTLPAGVADGSVVRVQVQPAPAGTAVWTVLGLAAAPPAVPEGREGRVEGLVTAFTSLAAFSVGGVPVDATRAGFPDGSAGIVLGARLSVQGPVQGGVLQARRVSIETEAEQAASFVLEGTIGARDATALTFKIRGVTVSYGGSGVVFEGGSAANVANGTKVRVQGTLSADGKQLEARRITFTG